MWIVIVFCCLLGTAAFGTEVYVSPQGNDAWSGTREKPFATPARARDAVRQLRVEQPGPATVYFRGGTYEISEPLILSPADSGPVEYVAYGDEEPVVSGGRRITGWQRGEGGMWYVDLPEVKAGEWVFRQLFVRTPGQAHFERRYRPNIGPFIIAGLTEAPAFETSMRHRQSQDEFRFNPGDIVEWENLEDVELVALHSWSSSRLRIAAIDSERHIVKLSRRPTYRIGHWYERQFNPYYIENVREALGKSGEWYLDRPTGRLTYRPLPGEDMATLEVVAPRIEQLVRIEGSPDDPVRGVTFRGITFAHSAWLMAEDGYTSGQGMVDLPAAIDLQGARDCRLERCTLAHLGAYGIRIGEGSHDNEVVGSRMFDLGGGGVLVGTNSRQAEPPVLPTGNVIENNVISDCGSVHFSAHGIWGGIAADTRIRHNVVRRILYGNIAIGWDWSPRPTSCREYLVEYNDIYDGTLLLCDSGGIYTLGFQPGTVLRGNLIHDIHRHALAAGSECNGIFHDNGSKGILDDANIIYNTDGEPWRINTSNSQHDYMTWEGNSFGVPPDNPEFPTEAAARAGLAPEYRHLDTPPAVPPPVLAMAMPALPPPPPPGPIVDGFETTTPGQQPRDAVAREQDPGLIRVHEGIAASGKRSLKFTDAEGLAKPFYPYLTYKVGYAGGTPTFRFSIRVEQDAYVSINSREKPSSDTGVAVVIRPGGELTAGGTALMRLPVDEWVRLEVLCPLGEEATGEYELVVTLPGGEVQRFGGLPLAKPDYSRFEYLLFSSQATTATAFYIDDLELRPAEDG